MSEKNKMPALQVSTKNIQKRSVVTTGVINTKEANVAARLNAEKERKVLFQFISFLNCFEAVAGIIDDATFYL